MNYNDYMVSMQKDENSPSPSELIAAYASGTDALRAAIAGMTGDELRARPLAGMWSTIEVVAHLVGCELYLAERIERTIALERPLLIGVDERPYPANLHYELLDIDEELALFAAIRRHISRVLSSLSTEVWNRTAIHTETGLVTLRQLVLQPTRHVHHHIRFIAEKRAALGK